MYPAYLSIVTVATSVYDVCCLLLCCYSVLRVFRQILWLTKECAICRIRYVGWRGETAIARGILKT